MDKIEKTLNTLRAIINFYAGIDCEIIEKLCSENSDSTFYYGRKDGLLLADVLISDFLDGNADEEIHEFENMKPHEAYIKGRMVVKRD